jgi:hypothetical protein
MLHAPVPDRTLKLSVEASFLKQVGLCEVL